MQDYKKLLVWQKAHSLVLKTYEITKTYPHSEQFGLVNQLRRAAYSIPSNIVEDCGRGTNKELNRYLQIAFGSANEIEYQMCCQKIYIILLNPFIMKLNLIYSKKENVKWINEKGIKTFIITED